ncbi:putative leucine-rich repeat domain superfamily [Helianthus annuus]|nr:putative leucine-rich repeat domain superfamily [Helianthus annuus]KAJ0656513.1 putative leucine-rich repeat domain superfamily [Helianthus annuus]KAJ0660124.1 putative leucine-rich repeat domain superfamily [Helianthus annuus]
MDLDSHPGDEAFSSNGYDLTAPPKDEELTLDITSQNYSLPESINRMDQLKVLSITGRCNHPSKLHNLSPIACLPNLTTIRFEHVSVPSLQPIFALRNLKQLSFVMCEISDALMSITTYNMLPNLTHLEFDMCYDLKQLPSWLCDLAHLQKLSITNCHEIDVLPNGTGGLSNLESLSLHSCTKLQELPESIGKLRSLSYIDISDCLSIGVLPEEVGELCGLRVLKMNGCTGLQELPVSTSELSGLEEVICDEETSYLWMEFESDLPNLKINVVEDDRSETFMKIVQ